MNDNKTLLSAWLESYYWMAEKELARQIEAGSQTNAACVLGQVYAVRCFEIKLKELGIL